MAEITAAGMELPQTLHGQLYLLTFDRRRNGFDGDNRLFFGLALRAAMLTELYLTGHLRDDGDEVYPVGLSRPADPLLGAVLDLIGDVEPAQWAGVIEHDQREARGLVRSELETDGWLSSQQRRVLGIIPTTRLRLHHEAQVSVLADQVITNVRDAIAGRPADRRLLAIGLLGAVGQLPTVFDLEEAKRHRLELYQLVHDGFPPIAAMAGLIERLERAVHDIEYGA